MDLIPARYSILATDALQQFVAACYFPAEMITCEYWQEAQSGGNDLYLVTSREQRFILRVYLHEALAYAEIDGQARLCNQLAAAGISVPKVYPAADGSLVQTVNAAEGVRYLTLNEFVEGSAPGSAITEAQSHQYGRTLAALHQWCDLHAEPYPFAAENRKTLLDDSLAELLPYLAQRPDAAKALSDTVARLGETLDSLPRSAPSFGICHGDAHKTNLLCAEQTLMLIDFDCVGYSWRAYELAVFRWSTGRPQYFGGLEPARAQAIWEAFLEGYRTLMEVDTALMGDLVAIRHIWWCAIDFKNVRLGKTARGWINDGVLDARLAILQELPKD
jgi:Ser/Thr protein kinase RdoA (MazF antagonist)